MQRNEIAIKIQSSSTITFCTRRSIRPFIPRSANALFQHHCWVEDTVSIGWLKWNQEHRPNTPVRCFDRIFTQSGSDDAFGGTLKLMEGGDQAAYTLEDGPALASSSILWNIVRQYQHGHVTFWTFWWNARRESRGLCTLRACALRRYFVDRSRRY